MPKTKKTKSKRTVTCGKCKETGHNARTCPTNKKPSDTPAPAVKIKKTESEVREAAREVREAERAAQVARRRRDAPTADRGTAATAPPYRCTKCENVAILVIVKVKDYLASSKAGRDIFKGETRCEQCMNKPTPSDLILVWGAKPDEVFDYDNSV